MQLHEVKRKNKNYKSTQVGRGGTRGKTSGRGTKGQKSRAGHKIRPALRDIIKKLPKMRGRGKSSFKSIQTTPVVVSLAKINAAFNAGDTVTRSSLLEKKIISRARGTMPRVKILGTGTLDKKLTFSDIPMSAGIKAIIEKSGGVIQ